MSLGQLIELQNAKRQAAKAGHTLEVVGTRNSDVFARVRNAKGQFVSIISI